MVSIIWLNNYTTSYRFHLLLLQCLHVLNDNRGDFICLEYWVNVERDYDWVQVGDHFLGGVDISLYSYGADLFNALAFCRDSGVTFTLIDALVYQGIS